MNQPQIDLVPILITQIREMIKHGAEPWRIVCHQHIHDQLLRELRQISQVPFKTIEKLWIDGKSYVVEIDNDAEKPLCVEDLKIQAGVS